MRDKAVAPFSAAQVERLHQYQFGPFASAEDCMAGRGRFRMHPFTCPNRGDGNHFDNGSDLGALIPTVRGWICQCCDYTQGWAHDFMSDPSPLPATPSAAPAAGVTP